MSTANEPHIELADAVQTIRDELLTAARRSTGHDIVFELGDIQMEFTVEMRREAKAGAKVKACLYVYKRQTHKVSVTLRAQDARTGAPLKVRNGTEGSVDAFGRGTPATP
ncbi:trypco2 family protein [Streptomyces resistomycificus]|uniref:trypco2 family protein n=1 Tax=Streptomyces resistomycificus TaxID=67356 RepID=UPI0004ABCA72|nr:trypco2 family protein [Streptomyces resistomycificus]